jgi:hypothetical protein
MFPFTFHFILYKTSTSNKVSGIFDHPFLLANHLLATIFHTNTFSAVHNSFLSSSNSAM